MSTDQANSIIVILFFIFAILLTMACGFAQFLHDIRDELRKRKP